MTKPRPATASRQRRHRDQAHHGVDLAGELTQRRIVDGGMGFASQNDRRLHFGLGGQEWVDRVVIYWPSGERQVVRRPEVDALHTIVEPRR